jgi:hypothetical protein
VSILEEYARQGFDLTLRQLYYQFISRDLFPEAWADEDGVKNRQRNYDRLGTIISRAREGGLVDWNHIKDRGRRLSAFPHYNNDQDFVENRLTQGFFLDMWEDQPKRVEVWVEKEALLQVIESAADRYDVPVFATKGYMSSSAAWEAGHGRFLRYAQRQQSVVIVHLSDHDPSGINMTEDIQERLSLYSRRLKDSQRVAEITVERLALTMDQVQEYADAGNPLPPNPAKEQDPRFRSYENQYGDTSWELDAINPPQIVSMVRERIREHLDEDVYVARREEEAIQRSRLQRLAENYNFANELLDNEGC